jgi:hypothetical protein
MSTTSIFFRIGQIRLILPQKEWKCVSQTLWQSHEGTNHQSPITNHQFATSGRHLACGGTRNQSIKLHFTYSRAVQP